MKRTYRIRITKENIRHLKNELKEDESLESKIRSIKPTKNQAIQEIKIIVKLVSKNKTELVEQTIRANDGSFVGTPIDIGEYEIRPSKLHIIKNKAVVLVISWVSLTMTGLLANIDELVMLIRSNGDVEVIKFILIPILTIPVAFAITFVKRLLINFQSD